MDSIIVTLIWTVITAGVGAGVASCTTDQTTLRHCAVAGESKMQGGGTIVCSVKRETK